MEGAGRVFVPHEQQTELRQILRMFKLFIKEKVPPDYL